MHRIKIDFFDNCAHYDEKKKIDKKLIYINLIPRNRDSMTTDNQGNNSSHQKWHQKVFLTERDL